MAVWLSLQKLPPAQIADLLRMHPSAVGAWIHRFDTEGVADLADRSRPDGPASAGRGCSTGSPVC
ncbi:helix-turn-helix domain-containing protein [Nocardia nova]|nr:helix-turn-helix domain-containing protein [Nocardia nova]